jgi:homocitrate synthase NifV
VKIEYKIVDSTLRDGEQKCGLAFNLKEKIRLAKKIAELGVYQIEAGIPAGEGEEKESVYRIKQLALSSKISGWNRLNIKDIKHSIECDVDIVHMAVPISDIQIKEKLNKDREWIIDNLKECIYYAKSKGFETTIGLEDASRADISFLKTISSLCLNEGVSRIRFADTVGILSPMKIFNVIKSIKSECNIAIEIHTHNDFGLAVANSIAAIKAGAEFVDCTLNGIGERAGNCDYYKFIEAVGVMNG